MGVWFCCDEDKGGGVTWGTEVRACSQLGWIIRQQIDVVCYAKAQLGATTGPSFPRRPHRVVRWFSAVSKPEASIGVTCFEK